MNNYNLFQSHKKYCMFCVELSWLRVMVTLQCIFWNVWQIKQVKEQEKRHLILIIIRVIHIRFDHSEHDIKYISVYYKKKHLYHSFLLQSCSTVSQGKPCASHSTKTALITSAREASLSPIATSVVWSHRRSVQLHSQRTIVDYTLLVL